MVAGATEVAAGIIGDGAAIVGEIGSVGIATPVALPLAAASTGAIVHGVATGSRAAENLRNDKGRVNADGRSGKGQRLKELANDPKESSANRGWIKQDGYSGSKRATYSGQLEPLIPGT